MNSLALREVIDIKEPTANRHFGRRLVKRLGFEEIVTNHIEWLYVAASYHIKLLCLLRVLQLP